MCDDTRNDSRLLATCPVCGRRFQPVGRGRYCTPSCRQQAHRLRRRQVDRATLTDPADQVRRQRRLTEQTIYECPACQARLLGERRCGECNLMCRKLGLGGRCQGCDELITIGELLDIDLRGGDAVA